MSRETPFYTISRCTFVQRLTGLVGLVVAGCDLPWHKSSSSSAALSKVVTYYDRSGSSHQEQVATLPNQGYRFISPSVCGHPANPLYTAVWIQRDGPDWQPFHDLDAAQYQNAYDL